MIRFNFGSIVIVENNLIGVVVKSWGNVMALALDTNAKWSHEVYVKSLNTIREYSEEDIKPYIYDKELSDEQMDYQE